jgi:hypothetical protein
MASVAVPPTELSYVDPSEEYADFRDFHERVGRALVQVLALSYRIAITTRPDGQPLLTLDDLRQIRPEVANAQDDAAPLLAQVGPQASGVWGFFRYLLDPESDRIVKPAALGDDEPGRWVLQTLPLGADCGTRRYLAHVEYCADQVENRELINRCRDKTPALFISLQGDDLEEVSQTMAFHKVTANYRLRVVSANFHGGVQARFQSPLAIDRESDPGTQRILGDVRRALVHDNRLLNCLGVEKLTLGSMRPLYERDAERMLVDSVQVRILGYVHSPNAPCEIVAPWVMWLQLQDELGRNAGPPNEVPGS